jgi:hypothetical protein
LVEARSGRYEGERIHTRASGSENRRVRAREAGASHARTREETRVNKQQTTIHTHQLQRGDVPRRVQQAADRPGAAGAVRARDDVASADARSFIGGARAQTRAFVGGHCTTSNLVCLSGATPSPSARRCDGLVVARSGRYEGERIHTRASGSENGRVRAEEADAHANDEQHHDARVEGQQQREGVGVAQHKTTPWARRLDGG